MKCETDLSAVWHKSVHNLSTATEQSHDVRRSLCRLQRRAILSRIIKLLPLHLRVTTATASREYNECMQTINQRNSDAFKNAATKIQQGQDNPDYVACKLMQKTTHICKYIKDFPKRKSNCILQSFIDKTRNMFCGACYLPHSWVHYDWHCHLVFMSQLLAYLQQTTLLFSVNPRKMINRHFATNHSN